MKTSKIFFLGVFALFSAGLQAQRPEITAFPDSLIAQLGVKEIRCYQMPSTRANFEKPKTFVLKQKVFIRKYYPSGQIAVLQRFPEEKAIHQFTYHFDYKGDPSGNIYEYFLVTSAGDTMRMVHQDQRDYYSNHPETPDSTLWFDIGANDKRIPERKIVRSFNKKGLYSERYFEKHSSKSPYKTHWYAYPDERTVVEVKEMHLSGYRDSSAYYLDSLNRFIRSADYLYIYEKPLTVYTDYTYDKQGRWETTTNRSSNQVLMDRDDVWPMTEHKYRPDGLPDMTFKTRDGESGLLWKYQYEFFPKEPPKEGGTGE